MNMISYNRPVYCICA